MAGYQEKYAYLDQLSTQELEELLRADLSSAEDGQDDAVFHIVEVMLKREMDEPAGAVPDTDAAWKEFKQYYDIPEGSGLSLYPCGDADASPTSAAGADLRPRARRRRILWRSSLIVAAAMAALLCGMVAAQASGVDVFGTLGRWTNDTFRFISRYTVGEPDDGMSPEYRDIVRSTLAGWGAEDLFPTWSPEGFEASEPIVMSNSGSNCISVDFSSKNKFYYAEVTHFYNVSSLPGAFEKDSYDVDEYMSNGKLFYIFSNIDTLSATWFDGEFMVMISGTLTTDEIKAIIDSIGAEKL